MASEGAASDAQKSKQERIRENQRRSRQRRQDHLADLEKRLADCHNTCRSADLQQAAFAELQIENLRLRELLVLVGVGTSAIDTYVRHDFTSEEASKQALRHLKPKLPTENDFNCQRFPNVGHSTASASSSCCKPSNAPSPYLDHISYSMALPTFVSDSGASDSPASTSFQPRLSNERLEAAGITTYGDESVFRCDAFHIGPNGPLLKNPEDTILCSVAKELIDQYIVNEQDMEEIQSRLARGFARPAIQGQGCRVSNQLLFEILNDISSRVIGN